MDKSNNFRVVYSTHDFIDWQLVVNLLLEHGLEHRTNGGQLLASDLGMGNHALSHSIEVRESLFDKASELIAKHLESFGDIEGCDAALEQLALSSGPKVATVKVEPQVPVRLNFHSLEVRRVEPLSLAFLTFMFGLLCAGLFLVFSVLSNASIQSSFNIFLFGGVGGLLGGLVMAWLYNFFSSLVGGVRYSVCVYSELLSQEFNQGNCFYQDLDGNVFGSVSLSELTRMRASGEIEPSQKVQVGDVLLLAANLEKL